MYDPQKMKREALRGCLRTAYSAPSQDDSIPDQMRDLLEKIAARGGGETRAD